MLSLIGLGAGTSDAVVLGAKDAGADEPLGHMLQILETDHDAE